MAIKSLLIKGDFSEADLMALTATFRAVERRQQDKTFLFAIVEADLTMTEGRELIKRIFPTVDGQEPVFTTLKTDER